MSPLSSQEIAISKVVFGPGSDPACILAGDFKSQARQAFASLQRYDLS